MRMPKHRNTAIIFLLAAALILAYLLFTLGGKTEDMAGLQGTGMNTPARQDETGQSGIGPGAGERLLYEEDLTPGFEDYVQQIDYAISQAMQRLAVPQKNLRLVSTELKEHKGNIYQEKHIDIYELQDFSQFVQVLRDSLLAWAEQAALERLDAGERPAPDGLKASRPGLQSEPHDLADTPRGLYWRITLDGATTHLLYLNQGKPESMPVSSGPCLVIVIDDIGESAVKAKRLMKLDFPVTFAIWPHSTRAAALDELAHERGVEILIHQPMEPEGYPGVDPGEGVLLSGISPKEIRDVLEESIKLVPHAVGMNNHMGSRLTQDAPAMGMVSSILKEHGFFMLDSLTHSKSRFAAAAVQAGGPAFRRDIFLDVQAEKNKILAQLRKAERMALLKGQAIAIGHPLPATLEALEEWRLIRDRGVEIVRLRDLTPLQPAGN